jgi:hypothetical protein
MHEEPNSQNKPFDTQTTSNNNFSERFPLVNESKADRDNRMKQAAEQWQNGAHLSPFLGDREALMTASFNGVRYEPVRSLYQTAKSYLSQEKKTSGVY